MMPFTRLVFAVCYCYAASEVVDTASGLERTFSENPPEPVLGVSFFDTDGHIGELEPPIPMSFVSVVTIPIPNASSAEGDQQNCASHTPTRCGYHYALAGPNSIVWATGLIGELTAVDYSVLEQPVVAYHLLSPEALVEARTLLWLAEPQALLVAGRTASLFDASDPSAPSESAHVSMAPYMDGSNGLVHVELSGRRLVIGAHAMRRAPDHAGVLAVYSLSGENGKALEFEAMFNLTAVGSIGAACDVAVLEIDGQEGGVFIVAVSSWKADLGVMAVVRIASPSRQLLPYADWQVVSALHLSTKPSGTSGCNRVEVLGTYAYMACFGTTPHGTIEVVDLANPIVPRVVVTEEFIDEQPTGMLLQGQALFVAGGRDVMAFDVSGAHGPLALVATCGQVCKDHIFLTPGQNAHSMTYMRSAGRHLLVLTAQQENSLGMVELQSANLTHLLNQPIALASLEPFVETTWEPALGTIVA